MFIPNNPRQSNKMKKAVLETYLINLCTLIPSKYKKCALKRISMKINIKFLDQLPFANCIELLADIWVEQYFYDPIYFDEYTLNLPICLFYLYCFSYPFVSYSCMYNILFIGVPGIPSLHLFVSLDEFIKYFDVRILEFIFGLY